MRRRAAAAVLAAVACALAAGVVDLGYAWLKGSSVFVLRSVAIRGGTESDRVAVRDAVARVAAGRSLLALSPSGLAGAVESVPTIRLATVDRDFPHTLRIAIVPERPVALAKGIVGYRSLVAASGRVLKVFGPNDTAPSLPVIWTGQERPLPGGSMRTAPVEAALDALAARPPDFRAKVTNVKYDAKNGIVMRLSSGLDLILGPPLELKSKLRSAAWVLRRYRTRADRASLVYADVSAPDRPAVMPRGGYPATAGLGQPAKKSGKSAKTAKNGG